MALPAGGPAAAPVAAPEPRRSARLRLASPAPPAGPPAPLQAAAADPADGPPQARIQAGGLPPGSGAAAAAKKSGVPGVQWDRGRQAWKVRWDVNAKKKGSKRRQAWKAFPVERFLQPGGSPEAADAAALREAVAFHAGLARPQQATPGQQPPKPAAGAGAPAARARRAPEGAAAPGDGAAQSPKRHRLRSGRWAPRAGGAPSARGATAAAQAGAGCAGGAGGAAGARSPRRQREGRAAKAAGQRLGQQAGAGGGPLRALSVQQPFAFAILCGAKAVENRSLRPDRMGLRLPAYVALHASARPARGGAGTHAAVAERLREAGVALPPAEELPLGVLLGVLRVEACEPPLESDQGWALAGRYRWRISDVRALPRPIECKGQQNLWRVPASVAWRLRKLLPPAGPATPGDPGADAVRLESAPAPAPSVRAPCARRGAAAGAGRTGAAGATAGPSAGPGVGAACPGCGGPTDAGGAGRAGTPICCGSCTALWSARRGLAFSRGELLWCVGYGPRWPVQVECIGFTSPDDASPYWVRFLGDGKRAWVQERKLLAWEMSAVRMPHGRPERQLCSFRKALAEAEHILSGKAAAAEPEQLAPPGGAGTAAAPGADADA